MLQLTLKNVKPLRKAKETTVDEPGPNEDFMRRRISAHAMNIFMKTVSISNGLIYIVYIRNTNNGYHLSGS